MVKDSFDQALNDLIDRLVFLKDGDTIKFSVPLELNLPLIFERKDNKLHYKLDETAALNLIREAIKFLRFDLLVDYEDESFIKELQHKHKEADKNKPKYNFIEYNIDDIDDIDDIETGGSWWKELVCKKTKFKTQKF